MTENLVSRESLLDRLDRSRTEQAAREVDPWRLPLGRLRGKIGFDGIERIATQSVLDLLEIPQRNRSASTTRRLARVMTELGWTAMRMRGLRGGGASVEKIRGYARCANPARSDT